MNENKPETRPLALLVDDKAEVISVFRLILDKFGYDVLPCLSFEEAKDVWSDRKGDISLVVTDYNCIPSDGGKRLLEIVNRDSKGKTAGMLCTGTSSFCWEPEHKHLKRFPIAYKPITLDVFRKTIDKAKQNAREMPYIQAPHKVDNENTERGRGLEQTPVRGAVGLRLVFPVLAS